MENRTYSKGLLVWIDDSLKDQPIPDDPWAELFSDYSDRVYRLLDLNLMIASSYEEALEKINQLDQNKLVGTYIYCVVDLSLPQLKTDERTHPKYGVMVAEELKIRGYHFSFLSSSASGVKEIDESGLGAVPYYVKEKGGGWHFPAPLALKVLSEFHRHVNWITLRETEKLVHPRSNQSILKTAESKAMTYYPFFMSFRDFVERCEYRDYLDFDEPIVIRSAAKHSDEFIFQSLMVYFYPLVIRRSDRLSFLYGYADDKVFQRAISPQSIRDSDGTIPIARIVPERIGVKELTKLIEEGKNRKMVFILPDDESIDPYMERLREYNISTVEELPKVRAGDFFQQEELIKRSCTLIFQDWYSRQPDLGDSVLLNKGSFSHPELMINPINWTILLETSDVPEELSDPYEILMELLLVMDGMSARQSKAVSSLLQSGEPIEYKYLLKVGQETLTRIKKEKGEFRAWIETTLDVWLKSSHQFPYGIHDFSDRSQFVPDPDKRKVIFAKREKWEDSCYEILVKLLDEYKRRNGFNIKSTDDTQKLHTVNQFIRLLGDTRLLDNDLDFIDWEALEQTRWPHRFYPLPSAVFGRIREAGKYLWIQPDGLDLALAFPTGRGRYRDLGAMVDRYWRTLNWLMEVSPYLPVGWGKNIEYLTDIIINHRTHEVFKNEQDKLKEAFICLVSNGGPVLFIANSLLGGNPINKAEEYLSSIQGYGKILEYVRGHQVSRAGQWIVPVYDSMALEDDLRQINLAWTLYKKRMQVDEGQAEGLVGEIGKMVKSLASSFGEAGYSELPIKKEIDANQMTSLMMELLRDEQLMLYDSKGWFVDNLDKLFPKHLDYGVTPSTLGLKVDYLWLFMDTVSALNNLTRQFRYSDGYHFLSVSADLRNSTKLEVEPDIPEEMIESILELFVYSIEGIIAQMSWLVGLAGELKISQRIAPKTIKINDEHAVLPDKDEIRKLLRLKSSSTSWELFTLGTPGKVNSRNFTYHDGRSVHKLVLKE